MELPDWDRAHGQPLFAARIRSIPDDFQVTEIIDFEFSGDGEHDFLYIRKTGANTEWVARQLARHADVPVRDVGYSGLKDRHAITRQWFSVPRWNAPQWHMLNVEGVELLDQRRHVKKLRRGSHRCNRFRIVLRGDDCVRASFAERAQAISERGVPNYFGEQRFGRDGNNLAIADGWSGGKRLSRHMRGIAISTVRSFAFNQALNARVHDGTWNTLIDGDVANLDGSRSVFDIVTVDDKLRRRCQSLDIHPAGLLPGDGDEVPGYPRWSEALSNARVESSRRSLRLLVQDLKWNFDDAAVVLEFALGKGAYATSVLREIANFA